MQNAALTLVRSPLLSPRTVNSSHFLLFSLTTAQLHGDIDFIPGNAEANNLDTGEGSMEAVYFGNYNTTGKGWCGGVGPGPFVMADLESGIWACADRPGVNNGTVPMTSTFVTAMVKGFGDVPPYGRWQLRAGDASSGALSTQFDGPRPQQAQGRAPYYPMKLTGSIILGEEMGATEGRYLNFA